MGDYASILEGMLILGGMKYGAAKKKRTELIGDPPHAKNTSAPTNPGTGGAIQEASELRNTAKKPNKDK